MAIECVTADADTFTCNAFLSVNGRSTLVDVGAMPGVVDVIRASTREVDAVMITHQHSDHIEQLDAVIDAFDPDVYAYESHPHRTHELADGDQVQIGNETFTVCYSPGHAEDHVAFISPTTIFSGDVVVHNDGAFDYGSYGRTDIPGGSREVLIESIERILSRLPDGVEHMYAGHGDSFHGDVRDVISTALDRAKERTPKYPDE